MRDGNEANQHQLTRIRLPMTCKASGAATLISGYMQAIMLESANSVSTIDNGHSHSKCMYMIPRNEDNERGASSSFIPGSLLAITGITFYTYL